MVTLCPGCRQDMGFSWVYSTTTRGRIYRWECKKCGYLFNSALTYKMGRSIGEDHGGEKLSKVLGKLKLKSDPPSIFGYINLNAVREDVSRIKNPVNECPGGRKIEQWEDGRTGQPTITSRHPCRECY